jgi:hypothetical protein
MVSIVFAIAACSAGVGSVSGGTPGGDTPSATAAAHPAATRSPGLTPTEAAATASAPASQAPGAAASAPSATGVPASASGSTGPSSAGNVSVQLLGFPASITLGTDAVTFNVTLTNNGSSALSDVAPLFQLVGGPCRCVLGSLERRDAPADAWQQAPMPEGDGDPDYLALATGGFTLAPGQSVDVSYLLSLSSQNPAKAVFADLYAVGLPAGTELAQASVPSKLVVG